MKHPLDNQTVDWVEDKTRPTSKNLFEHRFSILVYAVRADEFTTGDVFECVISLNKRSIQRCVADLVDLGYLERKTATTYVATDFAKELMGVAA